MKFHMYTYDLYRVFLSLSCYSFFFLNQFPLREKFISPPPLSFSQHLIYVNVKQLNKGLVR